MVSLSSYIPDSTEDGPSVPPATLAGSPAEEFPPLPGAAAAPVAGTAAAGATAAIGSSSGSGGSTTPKAGASPADNPLLAAFAAERRMLEQLRDDVEAKLASFKVWRMMLAGKGCAAWQGPRAEVSHPVLGV